MYKYSPIKKLYIKNFRNLGEVEIDFTQSPIITLLGENEAGKTSVIKAFQTCALHANPREQKDYIRDTTQMFGIAIDLEDGTRITRIKETSINSYKVTRPDGTVWETNKITDGLPAEVSEVMGLIEEPETKEYLHVRTYEDKLLFVVTPNSTNYKVMYNALKVEQLTKAIKNGSNEVNALKSAINTNDISIQTLGNQVKDLIIIDTEPIENIKARLQEGLQRLDKLERLKLLNDKLNNCERQLGALGLLDRFNLQPVNEVTASKLSSINRLLNNRTSLKNCRNIINESNNIDFIDTNILDKISNIINKKANLHKKINDAGALTHLSSISEISDILAMHLSKARALIEKRNQLITSASLVDTTGCNEIEQSRIDSINKLIKISHGLESIHTKKQELETMNGYISQIQDYMKQCGVAVETCPKCGEAVIFDIDKLD